MRVKEIFATMQGEGSKAGSPAVFVRFAGCNLWSGHESTRAKSKGVCGDWCDTDFATGDKHSPASVVRSVVALSDSWSSPVAVLTGGEPLLQLRLPDGSELVDRLRHAGVEIHVETNGTIDDEVLDYCDHITVSPKRLRKDAADPLGHIVRRRGTDLKVVDSQWTLQQLHAMGEWDFAHRFIQACDTPSTPARDVSGVLTLAAALGFRVSVQSHKLGGLP